MNRIAELADYDDGSLDPLYVELRNRIAQHRDISSTALMGVFEGLLNITLKIAHIENDRSRKNVYGTVQLIVRGNLEEILRYYDEKTRGYSIDGWTFEDADIYDRLIAIKCLKLYGDEHQS